MCERRNNRNNNSYLNVVDVIPHLAVAIDKKGDKDAGKNRNNKLLAIVINVIPNLCSQKRLTTFLTQKQTIMKKIEKTAGKTAKTSTKKSTSKKTITKTSVSTEKSEPMVTPLAFTPEQIAEAEKIHERLLRGERIPFGEFVKCCRADLFMADINRDVDDKKVDDLAGDIKQNKVCWKDIVLFDAPAIWKYGHKLCRYNEKGGREDVTEAIEGARVCAYSPGDGQHRNAAALKLQRELTEEEFAELDIHVVLETREVDPATYIASVNTHQFGWNAHQKRNVVEKRFSSPTLDFTKKVTEKPYKMSLRAAFKLVYLSEVYNKSIYDNSLQQGKLDSRLEASAANLQRAEKLLTSFSIAFQKDLMMLKNAAAVDCVVDVYSNTPDEEKSARVDRLNVFFRTLPEVVVDQLKAESVVANKTDILKKCFTDFEKDYQTEAGKAMYDEKASKAAIDLEAKTKKEAK